MNINDDAMNDKPNLAEQSMLDDHTDGPRQTDERGPMGGGDELMGGASRDADGPLPQGSIGEDDSAFAGGMDDEDLPGDAGDSATMH